MIKIKKSIKVPNTLKTKGVTQIKFDLAEFDKDSTIYYNTLPKTIKKTFDSDTYGAADVKNQLILDQFGKCCFCESDFLSTSYGDIEHYRPKSGYKNAKGVMPTKPGYYWLAYDWKNLFLSCEVCNRGYKSTYFPLKKGSFRAKTHHDAKKINTEQSLLIKPTESPEKHLTFKDDIIEHITEEGEVSIMHYGLRRPKLLEKRLEHYLSIKQKYQFYGSKLSGINKKFVESVNSVMGTKFTVESMKETIQLTQNLLKDLAKDSGKYSLMVRCNFKKLPIK